MSERGLQDLLREVADTVPAPDLARSAWEEAGRRGRRRRAARAAGVGVGALAAAGLVALSALPGVRTTPPPPPPAPAASVAVSLVSPTPRPSPPVGSDFTHLLPDRAAEAQLPFVDTLLPRRLAVPASAATLTEDPPARVLALLQANGEGPAPVYALGIDGRYRRLGVELKDTVDAGGNRAHALRATSLSSDGRRAAFPQPQAVVVVELTTGEHRRFPVPGLNEQVTWRPGGTRLLVGREGRAVELDPATGDTVPVGSTRWSTTYASDGTAVIELGERALLRWPPGAQAPERVNVDPRLGQWWGAPWARGGRVAGALFLPGSAGEGSAYQGVALLDATEGTLLTLLGAGGEDRWKGCCAVLGWLTEDQVLLESRGQGPWRLLAWDVRSGAVERVAEAPALLTVSLGGLLR